MSANFAMRERIFPTVVRRVGGGKAASAVGLLIGLPSFAFGSGAELLIPAPVPIQRRRPIAGENHPVRMMLRPARPFRVGTVDSSQPTQNPRCPSQSPNR